MIEKHCISWIELRTADTLHCRFLKPNDAPEAVFDVQAEGAAMGAVSARDFCNLHGYWKG